MYWVIDVFVCTGIPISAYILYYTLRDNLVFVYGLLNPNHLNQWVWLMVLMVLDLCLVADFLLDSIPWDENSHHEKKTPNLGNRCFFWVFVEAPNLLIYSCQGCPVALAIPIDASCFHRSKPQSLCVNEVKNAASVTDGKISLSSLDPGAPTSVPVRKYISCLDVLLEVSRKLG